MTAPTAHAATQMTSPPPDAKWSCQVCTYENFPLSRKCTMCLSPSPLPSAAIPSPPPSPAASPAPSPPPSPPASPRPASPDNATANVASECAEPEADAAAAAGLEAVAERLRPLRIASPVTNKWPCQTCTYENWPRALKCAMCGAPHAKQDDENGPNNANINAANNTNNAANNTAPSTPPAHSADSKTNANNGGGAEAWSARERDDDKRKRRANVDWLWLQACLGVVEGSIRAVEAYLSAGGDPARALTAAECGRLSRPSAFDAGYTLVHLAIRFHREEILTLVLSRISGGGPGLKRSASCFAPDAAAALRRHAANALRPPQAHQPAPYLADCPTFTLPAEMESLPAAVQQQLLSELLDRDAQRQLEEDPPAVNWAHDVTERLGCRLYALWNRSLGDCLPDAVSQCLYGVCDRAGLVRRALHDTLVHAARALYTRWACWERAQAQRDGYRPDEHQLRAEWARSVALAGRPGAALSQLHVFALAQVLRRPIILYGVSVVSSFRGEPLGYASFQGVYLPLLWDAAECSKSPLALGYTRGHFSALVVLEPPPHHYILNSATERALYLPLVDCTGEPLEVPFTLPGEPLHAAAAGAWLSTRRVGGVLCARDTIPPRPLLVAHMVEDWLNHYRRLAQQTRGPFPPRLAAPSAGRGGYGSDTPDDE